MKRFEREREREPGRSNPNHLLTWTNQLQSEKTNKGNKDLTILNENDTAAPKHHYNKRQHLGEHLTND